MAKLERKALIHYLDTANKGINGTGAEWYRIGADVEDLSVELNPSTETKTNILDQTTTVDNGYSPSISVDTYFADPSDGDFYTTMLDIAMNRKTGDHCKMKVLEVIIDEDTATAGYDCWEEDVVVKPTSYGGATGGVRIPYTISFTGNRVTAKCDIDGTTHLPSKHSS